jgi:hypothetical protein
VQKVNPDLDDYATDKAIEGLFIMIAKEEKKYTPESCSENN